MKNILFMLLVISVFGCQTNQPPKTEIIFSNIGQDVIENLWISIDGSKTNIGNLNPGENKNIFLNAIGNKRIDYGFKDDRTVREKMGGELFFYGNQVPMKKGILKVGIEGGLIHKLVTNQLE